MCIRDSPVVHGQRARLCRRAARVVAPPGRCAPPLRLRPGPGRARGPEGAAHRRFLDLFALKGRREQFRTIDAPASRGADCLHHATSFRGEEMAKGGFLFVLATAALAAAAIVLLYLVIRALWDEIGPMVCLLYTSDAADER